jgi:hypothetical protein
MSLIRFGRGWEYQFFRREDIRTRWDLRSATQLLNEFRSDLSAMATLRQPAMTTGAGAATGTLSDEQVVAVIARQMAAGELVVALPYRQRRHLTISMPETAAAAQEQPISTTPDRPEEEPTFDPGHDGVAQAAVLIAAAKAAYPFCEECQKHMVEEMQAAGR